MRLNRRSLLQSVLAAGAVAALPAQARAGSIFGNMQRDEMLRGTDADGNSQLAASMIDTIEPILSYDTAYNLQLAISQYEPFVAAGGWEPVPQETYGLSVSHSREAVLHLKRRLMMSGDMAPSPRINDMFDPELDKALRVFQARHGLNTNGVVDEATFYALNVPASVRLDQLRLNALRVQKIAAELDNRYVVVNIPAALIEAVDNGMVTQRHNAVVGRIERPTPIIHSKIRQINFNPYWHVPKSIIQKDLITYMQSNPNYLTEQRIRIYDNNGTELQPTQINWQTNEAVQYMFRQDPGSENAMGHCKINFYSKQDCYMHDTPAKSLFGENARFHSSGCVRVDSVQTLVAWLLQSNSDWDQGRVEATFGTNQRLDVDISQPVPIHTTYITAWANRQGTVSFRDDVYQFDASGKVDFPEDA